MFWSSLSEGRVRVGLWGSPLVGDLDGDGRADLVLPKLAPAAVSIALAGAGFRLSAEWPGEASALPGTLSLHDLDGDGRAELVYLAQTARERRAGEARVIRVELDATGRLRARASAFPGQASALAMVDYDGDGLLDALVGSADEDQEGPRYTVTRLRGRGDGHFELDDHTQVQGLEVSALSVLDAGERVPHVALVGVTARGQSQVWLLRPTGEVPRLLSRLPVPLRAERVLAANLDAKGREELVLVGEGQARLAVLDLEARDVVADLVLSSDRYTLAGDPVAFDLDGDGERELLFAGTMLGLDDAAQAGPSLIVLHALGALGLARDDVVQLAASSTAFGAAVTRGDFDGDGIDDIGLLADQATGGPRFAVCLPDDLL